MEYLEEIIIGDRAYHVNTGGSPFTGQPLVYKIHKRKTVRLSVFFVSLFSSLYQVCSLFDDTILKSPIYTHFFLAFQNFLLILQISII